MTCFHWLLAVKMECPLLTGDKDLKASAESEHVRNIMARQPNAANRKGFCTGGPWCLSPNARSWTAFDMGISEKNGDCSRK